MPISDAYVVQYLLQSTRAVQESIVWKAKESVGFVANLRGVLVDLDRISTRAGSYLYLTLSTGEDTIYIQEPPQTGIFRSGYKTEDHRRLACLMQDLVKAITQQCATRERKRAGLVDVTRQSMYRRLIGTLDLES